MSENYTQNIWETFRFETKVYLNSEEITRQ